MAGDAEQQELQQLANSLQSGYKSWNGFDWQGKQTQWTSILAQSKEAREQSLTARKQLTDTTKQFKRLFKAVEQNAADTTDEALKSSIDGFSKECRFTIKSYQEEIDNLTRRCKASESSYSTLCTSLQDLPDPASLLTMAIECIHKQQTQLSHLSLSMETAHKETEQQIVALERENKTLKAKSAAASSGAAQSSAISKQEKEELLQLRREVSEYEVEFRSLKNQDITIRKLEAKIAEMQTSKEEEFQTQLEQAKLELEETEGRRAADALEREAAMERKVQTLELQLQAEMAGRQATQTHLLQADDSLGQREAAFEAQRKILIDDAQRLREQLYQVTRERDELQLKVGALDVRSKAGSSAPSSGNVSMHDDFILERKAYQAEVNELSQTASLLRDEIKAQEEKMSDERKSFQTSIQDLENQITTLKEQVESLKNELAAAPSPSLMESMKRELHILKRLEYNVEGDDHRDPERTGFLEEEDEEKDLESVLVAKLRRLESEMVKERNRKDELAAECEKLRSSHDEMEQAKANAEALVASLESDLAKAISAVSPSKPSSRKTSSTYSGPTSENPAALQSVLDPDASPPPPPPPAASDASQQQQLNPNQIEKAQDDHSVATIVMAQRDRLRARCEALEAERDSFKRELQAQVQAAESLKADNTKLFEKMRYLQSYSNNPSSSGRSGGNVYNRGKDRDLDLEALEQRYEASVDPFRQFSKAERQRKIKEMSPIERTVFIVSKTVLGTKEMRMALFIYVVTMHLLVFITTYHWSHADASGCTLVNNEHLAHLPPLLNQSSEQTAQDIAKNLRGH